MKKILLNILMLLSVSFGFAQNALVINDNAFVVINGGTAGTEAVLVVNQPNASGIVTSGTGGNIVTTGEFDYVKWNVQTNIGVYTVPFTTATSNVKIPLAINIGTAGVGAGYIATSSWEVSTGAGSFNNTPYPSEVIHMNGANGAGDVSEYAVDRFWIMDINDPLGTGEVYTTEPIASYNFNYNVSLAETGDGNMLAPGNLGAQRYNGATDKWHGWFSGTPSVPNAIWGTDNGTSVTGVAPVGPWYRTWTLSDLSEPLPVELTTFEANCEESGVVITWQTSSELNNDYFEIQKSENGVDFTSLTTIPGTGSSNSTMEYTYTDAAGSMTGAFYRVSQVDFDGNSKEYEAVKVIPCFSNNNLTVYSGGEGQVVIEIEAFQDEIYTLIIYDDLGKQIGATSVFSATEGGNKFTVQNADLAFGNYLITLRSDSKVLSKKLILR